MAGDPEPTLGSASPHATDPLPAEPDLGAASAPTASMAFEVRFQNLSELARGGQGRVLVGHDSLLQREVALKELLHKGGLSAAKRFEREALLTARLQHPGIVSIYELVRRSSGEPVLIMRRVQGVPLDKAIQAARTYEKRLALLAPVTAACDAIAYAHQQGVIHRDIKASNVLVGDFGDTVVIDWGVAKVIGGEDKLASAADEDAVHAALLDPKNIGLTVPGDVVGTPAYMSPEQARGEPADAQSDVYALGALLYHLLAGRPPYEGKSSLEVLDKVREGPPEPLVELAPQLAPELSSMVSRAMASEKAQRYASAGELSEELKRFQTGRLVRSHSYSSWELLRRWARRNALSLSLAAIFLAVLAAVGIVSVRRVLAEKARANQEAMRAQRVSAFMTDMFKVADPSASRGNTVTAREILDKAAGQISSNLADDPEVRARLLESMGTVYSNLGLFAQAQPPLAEARTILSSRLGPDNPEALDASLQVGIVLRRLSKFADAEPIALDVAARADRALGPQSRTSLQARSQLGIIYRRTRRPELSEKTLSPALELSRKTYGPDDELTLQLMNNLSSALGQLHRPAEEEKLLVEVIATRKRISGAGAPETLGAMNNLGATYHQMGRIDDALAVFREVAAADERVLGPDHPDTVDALGNVTAVLYEQKRLAEVEPLAKQILAAREKRMGPDNLNTLDSAHDLGALDLDLHKLEDAEVNLSRARAGLEKLGMKSDPLLGAVIAHQGVLASMRAEKEKAVSLLRLSFASGLERKDQLATLDNPLLEGLHGYAPFEALSKEVKTAPQPGPASTGPKQAGR